MHRTRSARRVTRQAVETLESRRLLANFDPINLIGLWDDTQNFGNTRRAIAFYDSTNVPTSGANLGYFGQSPLFTVWIGYENTPSRDFEDIAAFDVDENTGLGYVLAFDSNSANSVGDTPADYDLYRFDLRAIYDDFINNARPKGIMYAPAVAADGFDYIDNYGSALPEVDSSFPGIPPGRTNVGGINSNSILFLANTQSRIGEIARRGAITGSPATFAQQSIEVVDENTILLIENKPDTLASGAPDRDFSIRTIERVSTSPGAAQYRSETDDGGYNGNLAFPAAARPSESWEAKVWSGDNYIWMDNEESPGVRNYSEVDQMVYVEQDGVKGVWISERDTPAGGDQFAFFKLDFATRTAQKQEMRVGTAPYSKAFSLREDPTAPQTDPPTFDGEVDWFSVDRNGNLVIVELSYNDTPAGQLKIITREVTSYAAGDNDANGVGELTFGPWTTSAPINVTINEPADDPIFGTFLGLGAYDPDSNKVYIFDADPSSLGTVDVVSDVVVVDVATGQVTYQELNAANHFILNAARNRAFRLTDGAADTIPPTVALTYNWQTEVSVSLNFSEDVSASLTAADLVLFNNTTGTAIPTADLTLTPVGGNNFKLTYKQGAALTPLPRGSYTLTVTAAGVTDAAGNALAGPNTVGFKFVSGDTNNDGAVNFDDLLKLAQNYGATSGRDASTGNVNYSANGAVGFDDLLLLAQNYGTTLVVAPPAKPVAAKATETATKRKSTVESLSI